MLWVAYALSQGPSSVTPIDSAANSIIGYITGFGCLGIVALALAFGWLVPRWRAKQDRAEARADLEAELGRANARAEKAEGQRDDALKMATEQLVPLLVQFTAATENLLPLLRDLITHREKGP